MIFKGDIGTKIELNTGTDLSSATGAKIKAKKPSGQQVDWTAAISSPASNGIIYYTTVQGDINEVGIWHLAAEVTFGTNKFTGETAYLEVKEVLE